MLGDVFYKRCELEALSHKVPVPSSPKTFMVYVDRRLVILNTNPDHPLVWTPEGSPADRILKSLNIYRKVA